MGDSANPEAKSASLFLDKDPRRIARMFDAIAHRYDQLNHLLSAGLDRRWRRMSVATLNLSSGACVVDICTGTADLAMVASCHDPAPGLVVGVDFAGGMLALGQKKLKLAGLGEVVRLTRGDACCLPCRSECADAVTVGFGIRNVAETTKAVREMYRVLRPGGHLAILEFGEPSMPVLRTLYLWYFRRVLPLVGRLLSRHAEAYAYLPASVSAFLGSSTFAELLRVSGFSDVRITRLTFGIVCLYVARKPTYV